MPHDPQPIVILGAGLAGLSTAYHLGTGFVLFEARSHPGGLCETVEEDGFRFDRTGHLLHLKTPELRDLAWDLLDGRLLEVTRRSRIFSSGVLTRYPFQANTFGLPPEVAKACLLGFIQANIAPSKRTVRNFEDFILAHFGEGIARHFMIPYNTRLWGVHPREITSAWCSRFVPLPTLEEVISGAVGLHDREMGYNASFLYPKEGIGALSNALAVRIPQIRYRARARLVDWRSRTVVCGNETLRYQALVSTLPLDRLLGILKDPPATLMRHAARLWCNPLCYLDVALERRPGLDLHWIYVPEERFPFYRVGCYSNFSPKLAPRGKGSLYIELAARDKVRRERVLPAVVQGLREIGLIRSPGDIRFARLRRIEHAYVVYDRHYYRTVEAIRAFLEEHRITSIGRYGRWEYSAMEDALLQGKQAAMKVQESL